MELNGVHKSALEDILKWRRDVRHFRSDPIAQERLDNLRRAMDYAPSVGNARPWRVMQIDSGALRKAITANFEAENACAAKRYQDNRKAAYRALKLAGLRDAPVHLAVFTACDPVAGHGLGRQTMPEMLTYSTVCAIHTLWLAARADNIGVGWVSILDPVAAHKTLGAPDNWTLTAYLCLGVATQCDDTPLLHRKDWQKNAPTRWQVVKGPSI